MTIEQRLTWVTLLVTIGAFVAYVLTLLGRAAGGPLVEVAYGSALLWVLGISIVGSIVGAIAAAVAGAVAAEVRGEKFDDTTDERDKAIKQRGEYIGYYVLSAAAIAALVFAVFELDHFWIGNLVYLGLVLSNVASSATKLVIYRRGF